VKNIPFYFVIEKEFVYLQKEKLKDERKV